MITGIQQLKTPQDLSREEMTGCFNGVVNNRAMPKGKPGGSREGGRGEEEKERGWRVAVPCLFPLFDMQITFSFQGAMKKLSFLPGLGGSRLNQTHGVTAPCSQPKIYPSTDPMLLPPSPATPILNSVSTGISSQPRDLQIGCRERWMPGEKG